MSAKLRNKRRRSKLKAVKPAKRSRVIKKWVAPKPVLVLPAYEATGFALIHKAERTISLATMRSNKAMVESLVLAFDVRGYRIGKVRAVEII